MGCKSPWKYPDTSSMVGIGEGNTVEWTGEEWGSRSFHDISNSWRRIDFQLAVTLPKHVLNGAKVFLVVVEMLSEFRSVCQCQFCKHFCTWIRVPSKVNEVRPHVLLIFSFYRLDNVISYTHGRLLSCFSKTFAI